eukprot:TRINITY_DN7590_c0_g1_i1.p1 TRINITY_DN7590_c0_g1~~TRINITY_DN7590_c0_g1_i1.p1  ORF type:complete len:461 (+),score=90.35 TRINITY_DN7590_c0_g1_i1:64-1446(+)
MSFMTLKLLAMAGLLAVARASGCTDGDCPEESEDSDLMEALQVHQTGSGPAPSPPEDCYPDMEIATPPPPAHVPAPSQAEFEAALENLDLEAVKKDVEDLLTDSQPWWPADFGNYGPFFVRLAWHCSGSFRNTDGVGGCGGGRQRFYPEADWEDNTNLDKARALLVPIKEKYGKALSWGDLFVLAGTQSLRSMGVPIKTYCAGRMDDSNGTASLPLGPSEIQRQIAPCTGENGNCQKMPLDTNLAPTTLELIYVNPEGLMGNPDPSNTVAPIRTIFKKMGHDDRSTVALIGGGHAFGKAHGACSAKTHSNPAGLPPQKAYSKSGCIWQGTCGSGLQKGIGNNTWTSGFEGPWTSTPTKWGNGYFKNLLEHDWEKHIGPGGHWQWRMKDMPDDPRMMLTSDMALLYDFRYRALVEEFAKNLTSLEEAFDKAWTGLTTNGGSWSSKRRCDGPTPIFMLETEG